MTLRSFNIPSIDGIVLNGRPQAVRYSPGARGRAVPPGPDPAKNDSHAHDCERLESE